MDNEKTPIVRCSYDRLIPLNKIVSNPKNPNTHSKESIEWLAKIIDYQGIRWPIVVSKRSGFIAAGHGRLYAAMKLKYEHFPVCYQDFDSEAQEYEFLVSDNKLAEFSQTDDKLVLDIIKDIPDINIDMLAMPDLELPKTDEDLEKDEKEDEVPDVEQNEYGVELGDVWELGDHRLMCEDSTNFNNVTELVGDDNIDMVFTDPPYNQISSGGGFTASRPSMAKLRNSNLNDFNPDKFLDVLAMSKVKTSYIFCSKNLIKKYIANFEEKGKNWNLLVMSKNNPIPNKNNTFLPDIEYLFCSREKGSYWKNDCPYEYYRRVRSLNVTPSKFGHPTEKQVDFITPYFEISCPGNGSILDLFLGSGTTLIACEKTNRKCYGMELDPHYCSVIIKRWEEYSGEKANRIRKRG